MVCVPTDQAEMCNEYHTDLGILVGVCDGHESLFFRQSKTSMTAVVVKDQGIVHNPVVNAWPGTRLLPSSAAAYGGGPEDNAGTRANAGG